MATSGKRDAGIVAKRRWRHRRCRRGGASGRWRSTIASMLAKRIIPCLDVDRGRVVKGVKFFDHVDTGDPVEQAIFYDQAEADELVFYDITASHEGRNIMADVVRNA